MGESNPAPGAPSPQDDPQADSSVLAAHDIRSPLTAVLGFSARLRAAVASGALVVDAQRAEEISALADAAERLRDAVIAIQDLADLDRGTLEVDEEPFDLSRAVQVEIDRLRAQHPQLVITFQPSVEVVVESDRRLVGSIVRTLLRNAVKHAGPAGPINVTVEVPPGRGVRLSVRDHGPGVPDSLRPGLFQRQFETNGERRSRAGLGLHLAARLAERLGGQVNYEPADLGAAFTFSLPVAHAA